MIKKLLLGWVNAKECMELRDLHLRLCKELKSKFDIDLLGFDDSEWKFHSTLISSKIEEYLIKLLLNNMAKRMFLAVLQQIKQ